MAKNEASIKFKAETQGFSESISKANNSMTELRSEVKLVDAQMANTGATVDGLEQKENILKQQQEQLAAKTQALVGMYEKAVAIWGESSAEAQKLAIQVNNAKTAEERLKGQVTKCNAELQEARGKLDAAEDAARDFAGGVERADDEIKKMKNSVGDLALGTMIADFATNAISSLAGLEESTRQYRNEQNKLEAIAQTSGQSLDDLKGRYSDLFAITADETLSSTAVANMSAMGLSTEQTNDLVHAATGIWAQYGDSIPLDGLMEAVNETSKVGTVTGGLADALNWAGINEDEFNEKLAACTDEQDRQQLIIDTLNGKYGELADAYIANNEAVMDVSRANEEMMDSQSRLAEKIAPLQAMVTTLAADGIGFLADNLETIAPIAIAAGAAFGILAAALNFTAISAAATGAISTLGAAMSALAANPIALVVAGLILLVTTFVTLWNNCEEFRNFWIELWDGLCGTAEKAGEFFAAVGEAFIHKLIDIKTWASDTWSSFTTSVSNTVSACREKVSSFASAAVSKFNEIKTGISDKINAVKSAVTSTFDSIKSGITEKIEGARDKVKSAIDKIKGFFNFEWKLPKPKIPKFSLTTGTKTILGQTFTYPTGFSISWHAKAMRRAMILSNPTIFGAMGGNLLGGGEAGREVVSGESHLIGLIGNEVRKAIGSDGTDRIVAAVEKLADRVTVLEMDGQTLATATAGYNDTVSGSRQLLVDRGLSV